MQIAISFLRRKGFKLINLHLKPCCYNDTEVFLGLRVGNCDTIYADEVYEFEDIDEYYSEQETKIANLRSKFKAQENKAKEELQLFLSFLSDSELSDKKAKCYIFSDDCQRCT